MKTISIINLKGGVAKTITAVNMVHILATVHGKCVLLIDNDKQGNSSKFYGVHNYEYPGVDALLNGVAVDFFKIIKMTKYDGLHLIPANMNLLRANQAALIDASRPQQTRFRNALGGLENVYDYCIIDNAPDINISVINALAASDDVVVPIKIDKFAFDGLEELWEQIDIVKEEFNNKLTVRGCLITSWQHNDYHRKRAKELQKDGFPLFGTVIRRTPKVDESTFAETPIIEYSRRCGAARDYLDFVQEYLNVSELDTNGGNGQ